MREDHGSHLILGLLVNNSSPATRFSNVAMSQFHCPAEGAAMFAVLRVFCNDELLLFVLVDRKPLLSSDLPVHLLGKLCACKLWALDCAVRKSGV